MIAKTTGILLLIAGAVVMCFAAGGMMNSNGVPSGSIAVRLFAGFFLLAGGMFTTVIAFSSNMTRGVFAFLNRLRGSRVDEEIARLAKLRADGYITGEEYEAAKKKLLNDL